MALRSISRRLLREDAYDSLRSAILDGALPPGDVLRPAALAQQLGLSLTPVREALARLGAEGLVETRPQAETRVSPIRRDETQQALTVVTCLHELAVRLSVGRLSSSELAALEEANREFASALAAADVDAAIEADDAFHRVFVGAARNAALRDTIERYTPLLRRAERLRFGSLPGRRSVATHDRIHRAAAAGDVDAAVAATRENWTALGDQIARSLEEQP